MKLSNKKTGEIANFTFVRTNTHIDNNSLTKINEEWEDYKPVEPLIKDEKIRKAVRAWAEANVATSIVVFDCNNGVSLKIDEMEFAENGGRASISFNTREDIDTSRPYYIEELCGEEED